MNGKYYDPSYGLDPETDRKKYELKAFEGKIERASGISTLVDPPPDNGNPGDHSDEQMRWQEIPI